MKKRILVSMCGAALLSVALACLCLTMAFYNFAFDNMKTMIRDEAVYIVASLNAGDTSGLEATNATFTRVTLVDPDGTVVFDSKEDAGSMENHRDRPEIAGALDTGAAEARRYSDTLAAQTYYRAIRLQNGQVVRVSGDMASVWMTVLGYLPFVVLALALAVFFSVIVSRLMARLIAEPVNTINLDAPLDNDVYEELSPLLRRMEQQRLEIRGQLMQMEEQRQEFAAITANMREGLILLGAGAEVLSINDSALSALGLRGEPCQGKHILHMVRDEDFQKAVAQGLGGVSGEASLVLDGRDYQLLANPVTMDGAVKGTVLLLLDVTDKRQAEQMRREFTANVSHELKTPLTSISGFAEILKDGMVKQEDIPRFTRRIYDEARRLITLVDDILRLSRLDERSEAAPKEQVDLLALGRDVAERFAPLAERQGVRIAVSGDRGEVFGVPYILEEMVGNLCDNAVKYNRPGGSVTILVREQADHVALTVSDTGMGIPKEHQARVFERFYRVDKSHSKETGGTGLGLSIVKHGALFHQAELELDSEEGNGTTVTIIFPTMPS